MYALILQNHFFSDALHLRNKLFYLTEELILEETKIATIIIDEQSHGSSIQQKTLQHKVEIPTVLGQGSPSFRIVLAKMCYLHRRPPPTHYFNRNPARHITHHFLIRAKRVSNYYIPNKKFVRVRATNIGFRGILQTLLL